MKINMKNAFRTVLAFIATGMVSVSCWDDAMDVVLEELGTKKDEYVLGVENGTLEIDYYSNMKGSINFTDDVEWAKLSSDIFDGDGKLLVDYDYNSDFPRMAKIAFTSDDLSRKDTICIKQLGEMIPTLQLKNNNVVIYNSEDGSLEKTAVNLKTNIDMEDCEIKVKYTGLRDDEIPDEWVKGTSYSNGLFFIETESNTVENLRNAVISISFKDGWGKTQTEQLFLTQATVSNKLGTVKEFDEVRSYVNAGEVTTINDDIFIEGYIISDQEGGNVAENPMTTNTAIDYERTKRCSYIESIDGKYGFLLEAVSPDDNNLKVNTRVQILLKGTSLENHTDPNRYVIRGITSPMVISSEKVPESIIPMKVKYMKDLVDEDIYTRVTLKDCEFPVRKGSLTPINEGYANSTMANRINKFPTLIRDINGSSMYMYTNTTCGYRRDGSRMGYGKGTVSGVLVHEKYRRFIDGDSQNEEECGTIGRYQIRHQKKDDIRFADDFKDSFSGLITEYRFLQKKAAGTWGPTYGDNGSFRHTYVDEENPDEMKTSGNSDFSYLGPIGNNERGPFGLHKGNENGFGIILEDGTDWGLNYDRTNSDGKGNASSAYNLAFANGNWWDESENRPYAWLVNFSTKGYHTNHLSMQIAVQNSSRRAPTYWVIEWSTDGNMSPEADEAWKKIGEYYVPDVVNWNPTQQWQCAGFKPMDFELPLEMLGLDNVYIRLRPKNKICSSDTGLGDGQLRTDGNAWSAISYFAIRYNK